MSAPLKLYEHVDAYDVVLSWIDEHEEEISAAGGVLPDALQHLLDEAEGSLTQKAERTALVVRNQEATAEAIRSEISRLAALQSSCTRKSELLKSYLKQQMERAGMPKIEGILAKLWIQKNGRPSVRLANPDEVPEAFQRVRVEFDANAAYEHLKAHGAIPEPSEGAVEIDGLVVERGTHLRIR